MSRADTAGSSPSRVASASERLTLLESHLRSGERMKVVVTMNLGPDVMPLLEERKEFDVRVIDVAVPHTVLTRPNSSSFGQRIGLANANGSCRMCLEQQA